MSKNKSLKNIKNSSYVVDKLNYYAARSLNFGKDDKFLAEKNVFSADEKRKT